MPPNIRPLDDILVLDLTRLLPGAVATGWLADFGAEVVKVEQPGIGDYARQGFLEGHENPIFAFTNRGKKSVEIDLKDALGKDSFLRLVDRADVVIEGFRPQVMERLGLGFETLSQRNPRLIYVALTGYGADGKYAALAGHDINYLALSGVLDLMGPREMPALAGIQIADLAGGSMQAVMGILLALEARHKTGKGQRVDISMFHGACAMLPVPLSEFLRAGEPPERGNQLLSGRYACYQIYEAAGRTHVAVGAPEPKFWRNLCVELGCEELVADQYAPEPRQAEIKSALQKIFLSATAEEWFERLGTKDCCVTPVRNLRDAWPDHCAAPIPFLSATPGIASEGVPKLGEHTQEFLE